MREQALTTTRRLISWLFPAVALIWGCHGDASSPDGASQMAGSRLRTNARTADGRVKDQYLVRLRDDIREPQREAAALAAAHGGKVLAVYQHALKGFALRLPDAAAAALARSPGVLYVEPDRVVHAASVPNAMSWGLDRIDQRSLPLDSSFTPGGTGAGTWIYIIDSGIRYSHVDLATRVDFGFDWDPPNGGQDCSGHGTSVAGIAGGSVYGVARQSRLVAVRVLDCGVEPSGYLSNVIHGVDWVTANQHPGHSVANMSLGFKVALYNPDSVRMLEDAVKGSIATGITYVVAAMNAQEDACAISPARVPQVITVSATNRADGRASRFANFGRCVDIFAPGDSVLSPSIPNCDPPPAGCQDADTYVTIVSGTSQAAPHVAGVAAIYLQAHPGASASEVATAILSSATPNVVTDAGADSPNRLLFSSPSGATGLSITTPQSLPAGVASAYYSLQLSATGGLGSRTWSAASLPAQLTMSSTGLLSGAPNTSGNYTFPVTVSDESGIASKSFSLYIRPALYGAEITGPTLVQSEGTCSWTGEPYGGLAPFSYTWKVRGIVVLQGVNASKLTRESDGRKFQLDLTITDAANTTVTTGRLVGLEDNATNCQGYPL